MTDGDNATPDHRGIPTSDSEPAPTGNHADGISVADLIARLTGSVPPALSQPTPAPEPGPTHPETTATPTAASDPAPPADHPPPALPPPALLSAEAADHRDLGADPPTEVLTALPAVVPDLTALAERGALPSAPAPAGRPRTPTKRRRPSLLLAGRSLAAVFAVLALVLTGAAWQWTATKNHRFNKVAALDPNSLDILDPNAQFGDENFLIVGVDSRYGQNSDMGAGDTADAGGARSDSIILVNIPADRKRVVAVSFPRDLAITPVECQAWDPRTREYGPVYDEETGTYSPEYRYIETKLNSAYAYGGPKCLVKVVQKISGLAISRFIAIDFAGFAKMVDAVGGVEVCSPTPLEDYEIGTVLPNAGHQRIDGHTALNYVRARQVTTEFNGDYGRIKRQQLFVSSLLRSLISNDTFFSVSKINNVVNTFIDDSYVDNVTTKDLVDLGQSVQGIAAGRITFVTLPTTGVTDEDGNEEPYNSAIRALFDAIINDEPLPGENDKNETLTAITSSSPATTGAEPAAAATAAETTTPADATEPPQETTEQVSAVTTDPSGIHVHVANSTETAGLAGSASEALALHGFTVDEPDDHSEPLAVTTVRYSPGNEAAAVTVAATLGTPRLERVSGLGQEVQVLLGTDFHAVGNPLPVGSPVEVQITRRAPTSTPAELPEGLSLTNAADVSCE